MLKTLLLILSIVFASSICKATEPVRNLSGAYWTSPIMSIEQAESLAQQAIVIVDMENLKNNKKSLLTLKKINPSIKIICYSNPMEFFSSMHERPIQEKWLKESLKHPEWELKTGNGKPAIFWNQMKMMNLSSLSALVNGKTYSEWLVDKLLTEVLNDPIWDGYFIDNGGGNISWLYKDSTHQLDIDGDGIADDEQRIDQAWYEGIYGFLKTIRETKGEDFIIIANKGSVEMMDILNGRMFENWPNDYLGDNENEGWNQSVANAQSMVEDHGSKMVIFQIQNPVNLKFALASARLLDNVYVIVGQDNKNYYDDFDFDFGPALDSVMRDEHGNYFRNFEKGVITVNPRSKEVKLKSYQ